MGKKSKKLLSSSEKSRKKNSVKRAEQRRAEAGEALRAWAKGVDGGDELIDDATTDSSENNCGGTRDDKEHSCHSGEPPMVGQNCLDLEEECLGVVDTPKHLPGSVGGLAHVRGIGLTAETIVSMFDLHTHSKFSDGLLSPTDLLKRAARNGVKVLALTDHDTMNGVEEALAVGAEVGIRVIPGVELSATFHTGDGERLPRGDATTGGARGDGVHILGYFGTWRLGQKGELDEVMEKIRNGRYIRAKEMVSKLLLLGKRIEYDRVLEIAGKGVAPGRPHIARALVEAGLVLSERDAFDKYIGDNGPAYARGAEVGAEEGVRLIRREGGVAVLAHPWSLQDPVAVVKRLKKAGLQGMEVYKENKTAQANPWISLADQYDLMKLGGSDFHGTGGRYEVDLGGAPVPDTILKGFLDMAQGVWKVQLREGLQKFAAACASREGGEGGEPTINENDNNKGEWEEGVRRFSPWLTSGERSMVREQAKNLSLLVKKRRNGMQRFLAVMTAAAAAKRT